MRCLVTRAIRKLDEQCRFCQFAVPWGVLFTMESIMLYELRMCLWKCKYNHFVSLFAYLIWVTVLSVSDWSQLAGCFDSAAADLMTCSMDLLVGSSMMTTEAWLCANADKLGLILST